MLRILVEFLSGIIRVLAVLCIVGGPVVGYIQSAEMDAQPWEGALIGFAAGFLIAVVIGGLLASVILIENHLRVLADAQVVKAKQPEPAAEEKSAEESAMERAERIASYARQYRSQIPQPASAQTAQPDTSAEPAAPAQNEGNTDQAKQTSN